MATTKAAKIINRWYSKHVKVRLLFTLYHLSFVLHHSKGPSATMVPTKLSKKCKPDRWREKITKSYFITTGLDIHKENNEWVPKLCISCKWKNSLEPTSMSEEQDRKCVYIKPHNSISEHRACRVIIMVHSLSYCLYIFICKCSLVKSWEDAFCPNMTFSICKLCQLCQLPRSITISIGGRFLVLYGWVWGLL
jgi:hypothetical protein